MINFQIVRDFIDRYIKKNGKKAITGDILHDRLIQMVDVNEESYKDNSQSIADVDRESKERDTALGERIDTEGSDLTALTGRVTENERNIASIKEKDTEQDTRIDGLVDDTTQIKSDAAILEGKVNTNKKETDDSINELSGDIAGIKDKDLAQDKTLDGHTESITDILAKDAEQDTEIADLKATTQIKDMDVEVRNTGFGWVSSESAEEIYAHAIKGGNVKIQINDKKYTFVEYRQRTAYFRYLNVDADKVTEESIEIYEKTATFKTVEYKAIFDATPLLTSFQNQTPLTSDFISALDKALGEKKLIFVSGDGTIYLLIATSQTSGRRSFTGFGERTAYVLSYGSNRIVNLETHTIGGDLKVFNNENSVNILNLTTESTNAEIKEVFTEAFGEIVIPHTGDIFNIYQNSDVTNSGIVASSVEDAGGIRLAVDMSNFEDNLIHRVFYNIAYNPAQGLDSLNITNKVDNIINPSLLTEDKVNAMNTNIGKKADKVDVNEYNISAINGTPYASLQEALTALDTYLTAKGIAKSVGVKVTYVQTDVMRAKTYSFVKMGRFTNVENWADEPDGGYIRSQAEAVGARWEGITRTWLYNGLNLTQKEMIATLAAGRPMANFNSYLANSGRCPMANVRTNLPSSKSWYNGNLNPFILRNAFYQNFIIEHVRLTDSNLGEVRVDDIVGAFEECIKLKKIVNADGTSLILNVTRCTDFRDAFMRCGEMDELFLIGLKADFSLKDSPKISTESVEYIVSNRAESNPITFTLNGAVFDKLTPTFINEALTKHQVTIKRA